MKIREVFVRLFLGLLGALMLLSGFGLFGTYQIRDGRTDLTSLLRWNYGTWAFALVFLGIGGVLLCEALNVTKPRFLQGGRRDAESPLPDLDLQIGPSVEAEAEKIELRHVWPAS